MKIPLSLSPTDPQLAAKQKILEDIKLPKTEHKLTRTGPSAELLAFLRVYIMNQEELNDDKSLTQLVNGPINERNEQEALQLLVKTCEQLLSKYPTTVEVSFPRNHSN